MDRRVVQKPFVAGAGALREAVEHVVECFAVKRIVQKNDQVAAGKAIVPRVGAHQAHVAAACREIVRLGEVFACDLKERRRDFDAHDLRKRVFAREHHRAAHSRPGVDEGRRANRRVGKMRDQASKRGTGTAS